MVEIVSLGEKSIVINGKPEAAVFFATGDNDSGKISIRSLTPNVAPPKEAQSFHYSELTANGATFASAEAAVVALNAFIGSFSSGGSSSGTTPAPTPPVEVFVDDIKTPQWVVDILNNDAAPAGYEARAIAVVRDILPRQVLNVFGGSYYRTSDGYTGASYDHAWNTEKDIPAIGHAMRWVIIYTPAGSPDAAFFNYITNGFIWLYFKNVNITSLRVGSSSTSITISTGKIIECGDNVTANANALGTTYALASQSSLERIDFPRGANLNSNYITRDCHSLRVANLVDVGTTIATQAFSGCSSLPHIEIPAGVTNMAAGVFGACTALKEIILPEGLISIDGNLFGGLHSLNRISIPGTVTSWDPNLSLASCYSLSDIDIVPGYVLPGNITATNSLALSVSGFIAFCNNLGYHPTARTLSLSTAVKAAIAQSSEAQAAIAKANNNGVTIA